MSVPHIIADIRQMSTDIRQMSTAHRIASGGGRRTRCQYRTLRRVIGTWIGEMFPPTSLLERSNIRCISTTLPITIRQVSTMLRIAPDAVSETHYA
eukprot:3545038-Rhodomonas_salina.1